MNDLNKVKWKLFKIKDLFYTFDGINGLQVPTGAYINKKELKNGKIPRITVRDTNNGIDSFSESDNKNFKTFENFISVSFLGSVFYHPYKASLDMKVHCLQLKNRYLDKYLAKFLIVVIKNNIKSSSYGNQLSSTDLPQKRIMIPVKENEEPDYIYMSKYVEYIEKEKLLVYDDYIKKELKTVEAVHTHTHTHGELLEECKWGIFTIEDLFNIKIGKNVDGNKVNKINGKIPYITRKEINNGLDGFINYDNEYLNEYKTVITIGNETAEPFIQEYDFYTGTKVNILEPKTEMSKYALMFISQSIKMHKNKYSYSYTINSTRLKKQPILLPVDKDKNLDIEFMEEYIKGIVLCKYRGYLAKIKYI